MIHLECFNSKKSLRIVSNAIVSFFYKYLFLNETQNEHI